MRRSDKLHCRASEYQDVVHWDHCRQCSVVWLEWNKELTMTTLTIQSVTDLLNNQDHSGLTFN